MAGITSRRKADQWIKSGRVMVNDHLITEPGARAVWGLDSIRVDDKEIPGPSERLYLMLNKPFGYICSLSDPEGRPLVTDLLRETPQRVYPVGRLDFDTLGLLLLTDDGECAHRLTHPRYGVPRTYKVTVDGEITDQAMHLLKSGVRLEGETILGCKATIIARNERRSIIRMTITQGKFRQVRRMLEAVGYKVVHLMRTGFGTLVLGDLKIGEYRHLEMEEVESLRKLAGLI
ncbi:MAG TPA: pseudouridine synthase [Acidobacteriota bacterium]|nr:pseudouridine synthase [Acidobacteriota bacterium]